MHGLIPRLRWRRLSSARDGRHTVVDEPTRKLGNPGPQLAGAMRRDEGENERLRAPVEGRDRARMGTLGSRAIWRKATVGSGRRLASPERSQPKRKHGRPVG